MMTTIRSIIAAAIDRLAYAMASGAARVRGQPDQLGPIWRPKTPPQDQ